jgi:pimeloyl-ACP methyl ester carboxylesterase
VHGTTVDHSRWSPVLPAFEERFTVLAMDRRGRGESDDSDDYMFEREFEDVAAVVDWAGEPSYLLGHSHGAVCALEGALLTEGVAKLILYEPPLGFVVAPQHVIEELEALLEAGKGDELLTVSPARWPASRPSRSSACVRCRRGTRGCLPRVLS